MVTLLHLYIPHAYMLDPSLLHAASLSSVFIASLLGSLHCVGMCGGFVLLAGEGTARGLSLGQVWYHLGRGVGYGLLGAAVGGMGRVVVSYVRYLSHHTPWWVMALVLGLCVVLVWRVGVVLLGSGAVGESRTPIGIKTSPSKSFLHRVRMMPFLLGLATPLLPCSWLYSFVAVAAITGEAGRGAAIMCSFWLGTLPALLVVGTVFESTLRRALKRFPKFSLVALIFSVVFSLLMHLVMGV